MHITNTTSKKSKQKHSIASGETQKQTQIKAQHISSLVTKNKPST